MQPGIFSFTLPAGKNKYLKFNIMASGYNKHCNNLDSGLLENEMDMQFGLQGTHGKSVYDLDLVWYFKVTLMSFNALKYSRKLDFRNANNMNNLP